MVDIVWRQNKKQKIILRKKETKKFWRCYLGVNFGIKWQREDKYEKRSA